MRANNMKPLGPTCDSTSALYHSQLSNLAGRSSIISGFSPTSASNADTSSSKLFLLSNLRRTPLNAISRGLLVVVISILLQLRRNGRRHTRQPTQVSRCAHARGRQPGAAEQLVDLGKSDIETIET